MRNYVYLSEEKHTIKKFNFCARITVGKNNNKSFYPLLNERIKNASNT